MFTHSLFSGFGFFRWLLVAGGLAAGIFGCGRVEETASATQEEEPQAVSLEEAYDEILACVARMKAATTRLIEYRAGVVATNEALQKLEAEVQTKGEGATAALLKMKELFEADPQGMALETALVKERTTLRTLQQKTAEAASVAASMPTESGGARPRIENLKNAPVEREPNRRLEPSSRAAGFVSRQVLNKQHEEVQNENE